MKKTYETPICQTICTAEDDSLTTSQFIEVGKEDLGDFVCGPVGIRMCIGDTRMGGQCDFTDGRLVFSVSDFHRSVKNPEHDYHAVLISDRGIVSSVEISCEEPACFSVDVDKDARFYRVEVFDTTQNLRIAIGNPIWNKAPVAQ